jgi:hypothetical protein
VPLLRSRQNQFMLPFSFWGHPEPQIHDSWYEMRSYVLKVRILSILKLILIYLIMYFLIESLELWLNGETIGREVSLLEKVMLWPVFSLKSDNCIAFTTFGVCLTCHHLILLFISTLISFILRIWRLSLS